MRRFTTLIFAFCFAIFSFISTKAVAQDSMDEPDTDLDQIEAELQKGSTKQSPDVEKKLEDEKIETFSDLGKLAPFSQVSIIQKRYMPKTGRLQLFAGLNYLANDPWYWGMGMSFRAGYFFTEQWGVEANYAGLSLTEKDSVKSLSTEHAVTANSLIGTKSYLGADLVWAPVYGKMSLVNRKIIPFDMYFSVGAGSTTTSDSQNPGTFRVGTGQIFAISKNMGFRWDFSWSRFNAVSQVDQSTGTFDNLILTFGLSFFFPEAKYR